MTNEDSLGSNKTDTIVVIAKSAVGLIPYAGSIIAEIIGTLIPNQRKDRLVYFVRRLNERVSHLEETTLREKMTSSDFIGLFEDGAMQSAKALSDERRDQIAALLANSLSEEQFDHLKAKLLINLLGEINQAELIILKYYSLSLVPEEQRVFKALHPKVFETFPLVMGSPQEDVDQNAIQITYKEQLVRLSLLRKRFQKAKKGEFPEFDEHTGSIKAKGFEITSLGKLLIRWIE